MRLLFLFLLLSLVFFTSNGQYKTKQSGVNQTKTISDGQPKIIKPQGAGEYSSIHCEFQDKAGNLWFSSPWGVYRYDGKLFTVITTKDGLCSGQILCILEDKAGNIWFGTKEGICRYDGKTFKNILIPEANTAYFGLNISTDNNLSARVQVRSMLQDKSGKIWFGTSANGVYCYDGTSFVHFLHNDGIMNSDNLQLKEVTCIREDKSGNIWFATWFEGMCRYDGKSITSIKPKGKVWFATIFEDTKRNLWFGTRDNGAYRYDGKTFTSFDNVPIFSSCCIYSIAEDKAGNIWFGSEADDMTKRETTGGVWCYDGKSFKDYTQKDGLANCSVFSVLADRAGNIWAGTRNNGLYRYDLSVAHKTGANTFTSFAE